MFGRSGGSETRSTRTFTETTGSGANMVTKTVEEETITRADGSKTTNRKETITHGSSNTSGALQNSSFPSDDSKKKDKSGAGVLGVGTSFLKFQDQLIHRGICGNYYVPVNYYGCKSRTY